MGENKNNDIKFEDLVDNYTYQQNNNQGQSGDNNGQGAGNGFNTPPYGNPFWNQQPPQQPKGNGYNIASLVLGILSIVCCCLYGIVPLILGGLSIAFFVISKKRGTANGLAIAGLICAIFGIVLGLFTGIYMIANWDLIMDIAQNGGTTLVI